MANNIAPRDSNFEAVIQGVSSADFLSTTNIAVNPSTHAMLVEASFTPSGTQDVNITEIGGVAFSLGQQLAAASLPVVLTAAQITTLTPLSTVAVTQSTSPWVVSGTVAATQSGVWSVTANAGTNLNTSALSLETTQQGVLTAVDGIETALATANNSLNDIEASLETAGGQLVNLGANNDVTVTSGTIDLGATDNAVLDAIAASVADIDTNTDGIKALLAGTLTVQATALDIRPIAFTTDSITSIGQGNVAHDSVDFGNPMKIGGYASAAAPTNVSGDGERVNAWYLRNGAAATVLTAAGALIGGDAANGLDVDVTRSALPTGASTLAEQQTQTASLSVLDDWDESDRAKVNLIVGQAGIAAGVGATGVTVPRVVQANNAGKTFVSIGAQASSSGDNTLVAAGSNRTKVYAFSVSVVTTTALTIKITDGAAGSVLWQIIIQTPTSVSGGANLAVTPPAYLFATTAATALIMNLSGSIAVDYSLGYYDEA